MSTYDSDKKNVPTNTDAYDEKVASQEEIYDEDLEEEVREALTSDDPPSLQDNTNNNSRKAETLDEQLDQAAEELITGDSDDPPLSEDSISQMLSVSRLYSSRALLLQGHAILPLLIPVVTWF